MTVDAVVVAIKLGIALYRGSLARKAVNYALLDEPFIKAVAYIDKFTNELKIVKVKI